MSFLLPESRIRAPEIIDDFTDGPDPALWVASYLPQWTTPGRAAARYSAGPGGLVLRIDADQPDWRPEDAPMRVSSIQTGLFSGPAGSERGTHRHRPDGLTVRTPVGTSLLWAPRGGRVDVTVSASRDPGCMLAAWLVGTEHEASRDSGEVCIFEIDARPGPTGWTARSGIKSHGDDRLPTDMTTLELDFDAGAPHTWTAIWGRGRVVVGCNGTVLRTIPRSPDYPMFLLVDLFEIGAPSGRHPKTATVHRVRGWEGEDL